MKAKSLSIRICVFILLLLHLAILVGVICLRDSATGATFWQEFFPGPYNFWRQGLSFFGLAGIVLCGALLVPPLAAWAVTRTALRMAGLVGLWISLPLTLAAGLYVILSQALLCLFFLAAFALCVILVIRLPGMHAREQAERAVRVAEEASSESERREHIVPPGGERRTITWPVPVLACIGLSGYLPFLFSLSSVYADTYDPYGGGFHILLTGWSLVGGGCQAVLLLPTLIWPVCVYLICLGALLRRGRIPGKLLERALFLSCLLNVLGVFLSMGLLFFSQMGDFEKQTHTMNAIAALAPATFFYSLLCSSILLGLLQSGRGRMLFS